MRSPLALGHNKIGPDPREMPAYGVTEAAHYLRMPPATLRAWVRGQHCTTARGRSGFFRPVIQLTRAEHPLLSSVSLVEAHVLHAIRREHQIPLQKVRKALDYLATHLDAPHPLATQRFETDGVDLFVEQYGHLVNISQSGRLAIRALLEAHLRRIEWDAKGVAARLYPRKREPTEPKFVMIDPAVAFGRPVLAGSGIPTVIVAERYKAGEGIDALAEDYGRQRLDIEEAIRCELALEAA